MKKALQAIFSWIKKNDLPPKKNRSKFRGQSLVEVAISFPILIMLFSGVVEFGFILNTYLSLLDATRDSARLYSGGDPFDTGLFRSPYGADTFYYDAAFEVQRILDPKIDDAAYLGRRIILDPAVDDVIVSVYGADGSSVTNWREVNGLPTYHLLPVSGDLTGNYSSIFTKDDIANTRVEDAPNAGILVVEIHYNYHHVLGLPWMTAFLSNPLHLQSYTIMPIRAGEPVSAP